jgi:hypothetical protein
LEENAWVSAHKSHNLDVEGVFEVYSFENQVLDAGCESCEHSHVHAGRCCYGWLDSKDNQNWGENEARANSTESSCNPSKEGNRTKFNDAFGICFEITLIKDIAVFDFVCMFFLHHTDPNSLEDNAANLKSCKQSPLNTFAP